MSISEKVYETYNYLHGIPEVGFHEYKTSAYLANRLLAAGYDVQTNIGGTGVVGTLSGKESGPVLAVRADIDALPHRIDGQDCTIHSCGHDAHSTMVLTAAEEIAKQGIGCGTLKIIFQPAEETLLGALKIIEAGVIDDIDIILGMHLRPVQEAKRGEATPALCHAAFNIIEAKIKGQPAHGSRPHLGVNAIDAAVAATNAINSIHLDPLIPNSVKVTKLIAGGPTANSIPGEAEMTLDLRAQSNNTMEQMIEKVSNAIKHGTASVGAIAEINNKGGVLAAEYTPEIVDIAKEAIGHVLGNEGLLPPIITPGGEDFHFYRKHKPNIKIGYLGLGCNLSPGLHHPEMKFDTEALMDGINIFIYMINKILNPNRKEASLT